MRLKTPAKYLLVERFCRRLIYATIFFAPILIKRTGAQNDILFGKGPCSLCSGHGQVGYPNTTIPFFFLHGEDSVSCTELEFAASTVPADSALCAKYRANAGYCGCPNHRRENAGYCSFCPNDDFPSKPDFTLSSGDTCKELYKYVSFLGEEQCSSLQYEAIVKHAYDCGCEISMPQVLRAYATQQRLESCSLCPDGSPIPQRDRFIDLAGMTCGDYGDFVSGLNPEECEFQTTRGTHELFAYQCSCPGTAPPVCPLKENADLCTVSLLNTVDPAEMCECYSFCDGEFVGCENYPGKFLGSKCPRNGVSGCNYAIASDDVNGDDDKFQSCAICPDKTNNISNPDALLPPFSGLTIPGSKEQPTCRDIVNYFSTKSSDYAYCETAKLRFAHYCGCDGVEPNCTLCPEGIEPSFKDKIVTGDSTCEDLAGTVRTWESRTCELGESYLSVMSARCGCVSARWPMCPVQQNPRMCTINRLRSSTEDCECYNFCGDEFHSCAEYPGKILEESQCPEGVSLISGCNQELATSQRCIRGSIGPGCNDFGKSETTYLRH